MKAQNTPELCNSSDSSCTPVGICYRILECEIALGASCSLCVCLWNSRKYAIYELRSLPYIKLILKKLL